MAGRGAEPDRPALFGESRDHRSIGQHCLVSAVAGDLDVAPMPGEIVQGANLSGAHPPIGTNVERLASERSGSAAAVDRLDSVRVPPHESDVVGRRHGIEGRL